MKNSGVVAFIGTIPEFLFLDGANVEKSATENSVLAIVFNMSSLKRKALVLNSPFKKRSQVLNYEGISLKTNALIFQN